MSARLNYTVRMATAPGETVAKAVPVLVDRKAPVSLTRVVENAIDRGLIVGPKPSAAEEIARGIAEQIYKEFQDGNGIAFGKYFYGRLYLEGTVDPNGNLTKANKVNARLMKGEDFNLGLDDFSFSFEGADNQPKIDWLLPTGQGDAPIRNELVSGSAVSVLGRFLHLDGDTDRVVFKEIGGEASVTVDTFTAAGPDCLSFAWPSALVAGKSYEVTVYRTAEDETERASNAKRVTVKAGAAPTGPELTGVHAPGIESPMIRVESSVWFDGTGLDGWTAGRDSIWCKNNRAEEAEFVRMDGDGSGAAVEFDGGMLKADEGAWSVLTDLGIVEGSEVRFKVTINGQSAEIVATVAEA